MTEPRTCYITVSDIAICQRCPMLLAYRIHKNYKSAWRVGMKGSGDYYGSAFHKHIAQVFFGAASDPRDKLHGKILAATLNGAEALEEMICEEIFMPYVTKYSARLTSGQIISMARGVTTWVKAMYDFFQEIPSLTKDAETVFIKPEGGLRGNFDVKDENFEGRLEINGRYDALMFNVDKQEARLFEFKGLKKSDVTVPLSQTLIYAWLLYKSTGIIPSIEIVYLDEEEPIIFSSQTVRAMIISALPELFTTVFNVISLRRAPKILTDKELCSSCKYHKHCQNEVDKLFRKKRTGASLLSVLIFFMAAMMIMTQAFFFTTNSSESLAEERQLVGIKLKLTNKIEEAKEYIKTHDTTTLTAEENEATNATFYQYTMVSPDYDDIKNKIISRNWKNANSREYFLTINDLNYSLDTEYHVRDSDGAPVDEIQHKRVFPAMGEGYYLIRAYTKTFAGTSLMYQVLVKKNGDKVEIISYEEVWY